MEGLIRTIDIFQYVQLILKDMAMFTIKKQQASLLLFKINVNVQKDVVPLDLSHGAFL
jgi:hypothetical protein